MINRHIFQGEKNLEPNRIQLQSVISLKEQTIWEKEQVDLSKWIEQEGTCNPDFLHLEDLRAGAPGVESIWNSEGDTVTGDSVLEVLHTFYQELYSKKDTHCEDEMRFLIF